jgi:hypothetical protein
MKHLAVVITALLCLSACAPKNINMQDSSPFANETKTAGVGDVFFRTETMTGQDNGFGMVFGGQASAFDLTVVQLTDSSVSLQYREYTKLPGPQGGFRLADNWVVKQGYNQEYRFDLTQKVIRFKGFEFKVIESANGQLKYQRMN